MGLAPRGARYSRKVCDLAKKEVERPAEAHTFRASIWGDDDGGVRHDGFSAGDLSGAGADPSRRRHADLQQAQSGQELVAPRPLHLSRNGPRHGDRKPAQGHTLYLALEDSLRRMQSRGQKLLLSFTEPWPENM